MMHRALLLLGLWFPVLAAAGPSPTAEAVMADASDPAAAAEALDAAASQTAGDEAAWLAVYAAEQRRLAGDVGAARKGFRALEDHPTVGHVARFGSALLDLDVKGWNDARVAPLMQVAESSVPDSQNADRFAWLAVWSEARGQSSEAYARKALDLSTSVPSQHARIAARLGTPALDATPEASGNPLDAARDALARDDRPAARALATKARAQATSDATRLDADRILRLADAAPTSTKVGVLLPLTGRFGSVGEQMREAITFGWNQGGRQDDLVIVDAGETGASAVAALETLVREHGVLGVAGPLLTPQAEPVAQAAEALGVPLIQLTQSLEDASPYTWVIQGWLTPKDQIERLVDYAIGARDWHTFVVMYPDNAYGTHAASTFRAAVEARGGKVTIASAYPPDATDFRPAAAKIARRRNDTTPPIIDFDAVFLPDKARRISLVTAGLAFEEIPMGRFQPHKDRPVGLLGLSGWNSDELISGGGGYTYGALFTDVFVPPPDNTYTWYPEPSWDAFVTAYRDKTARTPTPVEALGVDVGRFLAAAMKRRPEHRQAFLDALYAAELTGSITAATRIDRTSHAFTRKIRVLSVKKDGFAPVAEDPAP